MKQRPTTALDAHGREVTVRRLIPETAEDVEELRRRAKAGEIDDRESFADDVPKRPQRR